MRQAIYWGLAIFILALFLTPHIPFQDYADWIYQSHVFNRLLVSDPLFSNSFSLTPPVVPNSGATAIMGFMNFILSPDYAGRTFIAITIILLFFGLRRLLSAGGTSIVLAEALALIFTPSIFLFYGLVSYNFCLAIFLLLPLDGRLSDKPWRSILKYALMFIVLYYVHMIVMLCSIAVLVISILHRQNEKKITLWQVLLALLPVIVLFLIYYFNLSVKMNEPTIWGYRIEDKLKQYVKAFATIYQFNYPPSIIKAALIFLVNSSIIVSLVSLFAYLAKGNFRSFLSHRLTHIGIAFFIAAIATPYYIGGFGYSGDRFFWIGGIFIIAGILAITNRITTKIITIISIFALTILAAKGTMILAQGMDDKHFENDLSANIPKDMAFMPLMLTYYYPQYISPVSETQKKLARICPLINTYNRVPYYILANRNQVFKGIFTTGILRPKSFDCDAVSLIEGRTTDCGIDCRNLLLISPNEFASNLKLKLSAQFDIISEGKYFILVAKRN